MNTFKVTNVNFDLGTVSVDINVDPHAIDITLMDVEPYTIQRTYYMETITPSAAATASMLQISIGTLVKRELDKLYPPPTPKPMALNELVGVVCNIN
jgi:hypothetical protein